MNISPFRLPLLVTGLMSGLMSPTVAAAPDAGKSVSVPASFLESRMVRPVGSLATTYRVVVDVPAAASARAARPKITESSGDGAVDGIAWDYVKEVLTKSPSLTKQNRSHELRFPLRLAPVAISPGNVPVREELKQKPREGFFTPHPWYPLSAREQRITGLCQVKVTFPAAGGHPRQVILVESSGSRTLDAFSVQWALLTWQSAPRSADFTHVTTFDYVRR